MAAERACGVKSGCVAGGGAALGAAFVPDSADWPEEEPGVAGCAVCWAETVLTDSAEAAISGITSSQVGAIRDKNFSQIKNEPLSRNNTTHG